MTDTLVVSNSKPVHVFEPFSGLSLADGQTKCGPVHGPVRYWTGLLQFKLTVITS